MENNFDDFKIESEEQTQTTQEQTEANESDLTSPVIDNINDGITQLQQSFAQLRKDFESKVKYDRSKEKVIDTLHQELQDYREDLAFKILRPLIMEMTNIYDDLNLLVNKYSETDRESEQSSSIQSDLITFVEQIEETVSNYGFEFYQIEDEKYDRSKQKAQKTINTEESALDKQIVKRLRRGLQYQERIIRPEVVTVYRYIPEKSA